uniref:Putative glycosyltransferase n=1 Tax=Providencia alcalifaciens TaxID=126385 RepID=A0A346CLR3_9GAMM|nr:putative glycosyltransferase [Providencia alcalifaciens]
MKILIVIPSFYPAVIYGGPIYSTLYICREMTTNHNVSISVSTTNANMNDRLDVKKNTWVYFNKLFKVKYYNETIINKFSYSLAVNIWKDIKEADVIHIQSIFSISTPISLFFCWLFKKKIILSPRGSLGIWCLENGSKLKKIWLRRLIKPFLPSITFHATSAQEKQEVLSCFEDASIEVIPNGINFSEYQKYNTLNATDYLFKFTKKKLPVDKIIISMGRLHKKKGFDILINAFKKILDTYPNAKLIIAGSDEGEKHSLLNLINSNELNDAAFIIDEISGDEKIDFFSNADVFSLPSHNENFGNVYLESLASGTPIIASKNTPWESVELNNCGRWVENSVDNVELALLELLQENRNDMRENAKKLASNYNWENIAKKFKLLYKSQYRNNLDE